MKKTTKWLMFFTRASGIALIGLNLFRIFDKLEVFNFMQAPKTALLNSVLILLLGYLPRILETFKLRITDKLYSLLMISVAASMTAGLIFNVYTYVPGWDSAMHFLNGGLLTLLGYSILNISVKNEGVKALSPIFIVLFAFSFAMMLGAVWEIFEYASDGLSGSNMQRYKDVVTGVKFVGRTALADTMKDFILNTIGASIISIIIYFDIKKGAPYLKEFLVVKIDSKLDKHLLTQV